jgi:hypothetical protein
VAGENVPFSGLLTFTILVEDTFQTSKHFFWKKFRISLVFIRPELPNAPNINAMLWTIVVILVVLWALGLFTHVAGGLIHLLLVIAVILIVLNVIRGRRIG